MTGSPDIAIIGDRFMRSHWFEQEIKRTCGMHLAPRCLDLPWPDTPMTSRRADGDDAAGIDEYCGTPQQVIAHADAARIVVTHLAPMTREVFAALPELQFLGVSRGGPVNVDIGAATEHGVVVVNAPGRNASAVAEFTIGVVIAHSRNVLVGHQALRAGNFRADLYHGDRVGAELSEMSIGLIGYGRVGAKVAELLLAFGSRVLVHDPYQTLSQKHRDSGVEMTALADLLQRSDVVSLHQRVSGETAGMINRDRLMSMRPDALLVNTARGALLDYHALNDVMQAGHLRGAVLDTFAEEPPSPDCALLRLPNVILTPHISGASLTTVRTSARLIAADLHLWLQGLAPGNALNPMPA